LIDRDGGATPGTTAGAKDLTTDGAAANSSGAELALTFWFGGK